MSTRPQWAVLSIALIGLSACASTQHVATRVQPEARRGTITGDSEYVARVEQIARRRGIEVKWINPPVRRVASR